MKAARMSAVALLALGICFAPASYAGPEKGAMTRDARKGGEERGEELQLSVNIDIAPGWGETVTDENGTTYNFFGMSCFEPKVYPPEYWGVFPLFFFGGEVGIGVTVKNECLTQAASLRVTSECYCLNTDGSNGAQLLAPQDTTFSLAAGETESIDASFVGEYVDGADSGLDRFLIKVYRDSSVTYEVVRDADNEIKFEGAVPSLGEDGAVEKDTFVIYVTGSAGPVAVTTKAGNRSATTTLTDEGDTALDALGFRVSLEQKLVQVRTSTPPPSLPGMPVMEPETTIYALYTVSVASGDNQHALSHVSLAFEGGCQILAPDGPSYAAERETLEGEGSTLILVKEGVFCPPKLDAEMTELVESIVGE